MHRRLTSRWGLALLLLLVLWGTRLPALEALPLHNDEGLHLRRAVEVWHGHPFWDISDGKIINHWPIALFYPQHAPVFVGRLATVFVSMIGLAGGYALACRVGGRWAGLFAGALWLASPYLFFYERMALSDAQAGALVVLALYCALLTAQTGRYRIHAGLAFGAAALFKFTAAPYALAVAFIILSVSRFSFRQRLTNLLVIGVVAALCFVPPLAYLALRGGDFFGIALGWIGGSSGGSPAFADNLARLWSVLTGFGTLSWLLLLLVGLLLLLILGRRDGRLLLAASLIPFLVTTVLGREVLPRHYVAALPLALVLAGVGLGLLHRWLSEARERAVLAGLSMALLVFSMIPFITAAYHDPAGLTLPDAVRTQYVTDHSAGYGLREAMDALPRMTAPDIPVIASMFPDSCRRANFYATEAHRLRCVNAPGLPEIEQALNEHGVVYVLVDNAPLIGVDAAALPVQAQQIAAFPRPGESLEDASVMLWRLSASDVGR